MFRKLTLFGVFLTLIMVVFGSYLRLSGADQGLFLSDFIKPLSSSPAFYLTAALGVLILLLNLLAWLQQPRKTAVITTSLALLVLVGLQLQLAVGAAAIAAMPIVITTQVVLGLLTFGLLFGLSLRLNPSSTDPLSDSRTGLGLFAQFAFWHNPMWDANGRLR